MEDFKAKILEFARRHNEKHILFMFAITWSIFLYTGYVALYLPRFSIIGAGAVLLSPILSIYAFSAYKRFMSEKEAKLAIAVTVRSLFQVAVFMFVIPVSYIVSTEFTPFTGFALALVLYVFTSLLRPKLMRNETVVANIENLRNFDFLQGINIAELTKEQYKEEASAKKKAKAQMREDKKARKTITEANMIEIPAIDNPDLDISPQFTESDN